MGIFKTDHSKSAYRADLIGLLEFLPALIVGNLWQALHHPIDRPICFGVTSGVWDHVFGSARRATTP